jgi:hypothetical protein
MPRMDWVMTKLGDTPVLECELCKEVQEVPSVIRGSVLKSMITSFTVAHRGCPRTVEAAKTERLPAP